MITRYEQFNNIRWFRNGKFLNNNEPVKKEKGKQDLKKIREIEDLIGYVIESIDVQTDSEDDYIMFHLTNGETYALQHEQKCSEYVNIEDINGDFNDLIGVPVLRASLDRNYYNEKDLVGEKRDVSGMWSFYNISTIKGHVTIRWHGSSNGYYSEAVDFYKVINY